MEFIISIIVASLLVGFDQWTKYQAVINLKGQGGYNVIDGVFEFFYVENRGVSFGMLTGKTSLLVIVTSIVLLLILVIYIRLPRTRRYWLLRGTMTLMFAGALGNLIDRIRLKYVVDMLHFYWFEFPVFNIADICVVISSAILVISLLFYYKEEELELKKILGVGKSE